MGMHYNRKLVSRAVGIPSTFNETNLMVDILGLVFHPGMLCAVMEAIHKGDAGIMNHRCCDAKAYCCQASLFSVKGNLRLRC